MAQIFHPSANTIFRLALVLMFLTAGGVVYGALAMDRTPYMTNVDVPVEQPIQFSHQHHAGGLGIDCRYCHTTVEQTAFAGMPTTETCMSCHSQIWTGAAMLEPVRASWNTRQPLSWNRVHDLGDFAYFNHSIHIAKGVGCSTCHGRVDRMQQVWKTHTLRMEWCLQCHKDPASSLRPKNEIYNMNWQPPSDPQKAAELQHQLAKENGIRPEGLTNCSTCHR
ncbi:MAG TPA: cytochrome c3 family protein [Planctomycetota bacterium]|nr:cytochrome c3 family protein [Planctomycetota bacterium]